MDFAVAVWYTVNGIVPCTKQKRAAADPGQYFREWRAYFKGKSRIGRQLRITLEPIEQIQKGG